MKELIGHRIYKVELSEDATVLAFTLEDGAKIYYVTDGDCCSETWFPSINGIDNIVVSRGQTRDKTITKVIDRPMIDHLESTRQKEDVLYGFFILCNYGGCEIEFRNASNGYYGGSCNVVKKLNEDKLNLKVVKADF